MLGVISSGDISAYAGAGFFLLALGGGLGRRWGGTKKHRDAEENAVQQLTWSVGGKPADQWNHERVPGLIEQMTTLRAQFNETTERSMKLFDQLLKRMEATETSMTEAAAKAAKAVLDTARRVSYESSDAAALASAEVLATAVAAAVALALKPDAPTTTPTRARRAPATGK